jgi:hypothetical protein
MPESNKYINQVGHKTKGLLFGSGCKLHKNCFTCPFEDCKWNSERDSLKHEANK